MKHVLILAYDFPPYNSIGGQRPYAWYKYLSKENFRVTVVTRDWSKAIETENDYYLQTENDTTYCEQTEYGLVYRTAFRPNLRDKLMLKYGLSQWILVRRILSLWYKIVEFFVPALDTKNNIFTTASSVLEKENVDIILVTGEPFILFKYGAVLSKKYTVPWVADYRDGWTTGYGLSRLDKALYTFLEKRYISSVSAITTTSKEFALQLKKLHKKEVSVVLNGFFSEKTKNVSADTSIDRFIITFVGTLYSYQPIELIAQGIELFMDQQPNADVCIRFIGAKYHDEQHKRILKAFEGYRGEIEFTNRLPHEEALKLQAESSVFLLPANAEHPQVYAKVFDYLALKRPIILCKSDNGTLDDIIRESKSGHICEDSVSVSRVLIELYVDWKNKGRVPCNSLNVEQYSRENQTKVFAKILEQL